MEDNLTDHPFFDDVYLPPVLVAMEQAEQDHVQQRDDQLNLTGCSCGVQYGREDAHGDSRAHLRLALLLAALGVLTDVCDTCRGSGKWRKIHGVMDCPTCFGLGKRILPLPLNHYRDDDGVVWVVRKQVGEDRALVERR